MTWRILLPRVTSWHVVSIVECRRGLAVAHDPRVPHDPEAMGTWDGGAAYSGSPPVRVHHHPESGYQQHV